MAHSKPAIHTDPEILGGTPVFVDTRVPFQALLDYLEGQLTGDFLVGNRLTIGDIGVVTQFVNLSYAGVTADAQRWPKVAAYVGRIMARPSFATLIEEDKAAYGFGQ